MPWKYKLKKPSGNNSSLTSESQVVTHRRPEYPAVFIFFSKEPNLSHFVSAKTEPKNRQANEKHDGHSRIFYLDSAGLLSVGLNEITRLVLESQNKNYSHSLGFSEPGGTGQRNKLLI